MTIFLTIYFWAIFGLLALITPIALFMPVTIKALTLDKPEQRITTAITATLATAFFSLPYLYLQMRGLETLGLPVWVAYLVYALSVITTASNTGRGAKTIGYISGFPVLALGLAYIGLQHLN